MAVKMALKMAEIADEKKSTAMTYFTTKFTFKLLKEIEKLKNLCVKFKGSNANEWLIRREKDPYVEKAKKENYRCRSAFKLLEIDEKYKLIQSGYSVLDVGAAPGSWSQVLAYKTNSNEIDSKKPVGLVIAVDLSPIQKIPGVVILQHKDFTKNSTQNEILKLLQSKKLDFIVSDMAPPATGVKSLDQECLLKLVYPVLIFAVHNLKPGGGCLIKIWEGQHQKLVEDMKRFFKYLNFVKPNASYYNSAESYILGREFLGLQS